MDEARKDWALLARVRARQREIGKAPTSAAKPGFKVGFDAHSKRKAEVCVRAIRDAGFAAEHEVQQRPNRGMHKVRTKHVVNVLTASPGDLDWLVLVAGALCEKKQPGAQLRRALEQATSFDAAHRMGGAMAVYAMLRTQEITHG